MPGRRFIAMSASGLMAAGLTFLGPAGSSLAATDSPNALSQCPSGYFCLWSGTNYDGDLVFMARGTGVWFHLPAFGVTSFHSLYNHRSDRIFLHASGTGAPEQCYNAGDQARNFGPWYSTAQDVYLATTNNKC